jgi:glucose/mannose-6-phosphate isomerase
VTDLDDPAALRAADPGGMLDAVLALAPQCREGYALGSSVEGPPSDGATSLAFCGMGGSAIAGDVIAAVCGDRLGIPIAVLRTPELPAFCGPDTLVLASSYSGNTAETLAQFEQAVERGCRVLAITSGGELARRAEERGVPSLRLPEGFAMPRAAFGYLALAPLGALARFGLVPSLERELEDAIVVLERVVQASGPDVPSRANPAKSLALRVGERVPVIWGAEGVASVAASRWKAQWNENAKLPAFSSALPELDHNEVVGWSEGRGRAFFLLTLRHEGEHPEVSARIPLSVEIARSAGMDVEEVWAHGRSALARLLELVLLGDLTSTYLALSRDVDPSPIDAIVRLKRALSGASPVRSS